LKRLLLYNKLKVLETLKAHLQTNLKVPHPTLVAIGISAAITAITVGIFAMTDSGIFGQDSAESARKTSRNN
jgi:hypothetical protein